ncbi:Fis family transcriptional regulator [Viridibacillus sp. FSL H7-0596]|uniref:sigma-54 interaction domain-containing protein n=1 Tax=Viridibacillus sp. FSL H7-0596 TaxID=1928923 RepID=UPI00096D67A1|nr:sigma-54-dependent Fis family transcriptional regulator [Viridibacillus sp. FSL H7-0596]OMC86630.1 Fis family transcriptional regulator [Viridibacillus sp. FSL H7-0596]
MQRILIIGAGAGGTAILQLLTKSEQLSTVAIVDIRKDAPGLELAKAAGIATGQDWRAVLTDEIDMVVDVTGESSVFEELLLALPKRTVLIPGAIAYLIVQLLNEKDFYINKTQHAAYKQQIIFNSIEEGMIGIDPQGQVIFFNRSAARMTEVTVKEAVGKHINDIIINSALPRVFESGVAEINQELKLSNEKKIVTSRFPMIDGSGNRIGAFAVFKDISEVVNLAEEITNLKEIQMMLEAIIQSSDDAISVVDEEGRGILVNPAYTRITGLKPEEILGKPATIDISEGESMHLKVLQTKKPIRGVNMRLGPNKREVIVNVAPVVVNDSLKGSVGVIHDMTEMRSLTKELDQARTIIRKLESKYTFEDIIGDSEEMRISLEQAKLAAKTPVTVFLRGESGTGKELFAHAIHSASDRIYNKFIRVNCAAIAEHLLESELFGYEEGAFTGAKRGGKRGLFEEADKGSIFLDEIGEMSLNTQAKLLRIFQEGEIVRVGGTKPISINVRIIAATNVNMEKALSEGTFREDLYYRLNRMPIHIPPLRQRREDIPPLVDRLLVKLNQEYGRNIHKVTSNALMLLIGHDWPGNVRELENVLSRAMIFMQSNETILDERHLPKTLFHSLHQEVNVERHSFDGTLAEQLEQTEKQILQQVLTDSQNNKMQAAKILGISIRSLYYKLEKYNLA